MCRLKIKCEKCEDPYETNIVQYRKGFRCQFCFGNKYNLKKVQRIISDAGDTLVSDRYINNRGKLDIKCHKCSEIYTTDIVQFRIKNQRCLYCSGQRYNIKLVKDIIEEGGDKLLSKEYKSYEEKLDILCLRCNNKYKMSLHKFKCGDRCRQCGYKSMSEKRLKYTVNDIKKYVNKQGEYLLSADKFRIRKDKILVECKKCDEGYYVSYDHYMNGTRCPRCAGNKKKTIDEIKKFVEKIGDKLLTKKYINCWQKLDIECEKCKEIFNPHLISYQRGVRCQTCFRKQEIGIPQYTYNDVKNVVEDGGDKLIGTFKNTMKICIQCSKCDRIYHVRFHDYRVVGRRCRICSHNESSKKRRLSYEYVKEYVNGTGETLISSSYINVITKLEIKCQYCKENYLCDFSKFKRESRCPKKCDSKNISRGERKIRDYLNLCGIDFICQKVFDDCKNEQVLPFDFYVKLPYENILIEFDGKQHFIPIDHWGGIEAFERRVINDDIKNIYCIDKNIRLLRIPYYDYKNIQDILQKELNIFPKKRLTFKKN